MLVWFDKPACQPAEFTYNQKIFKNNFHFEDTGWYEALPVGNGRLGGMVFGGVLKERIELNEESLWDGYQRSAAFKPHRFCITCHSHGWSVQSV